MRERVFITGGTGLLAVNWAQEIREEYAVTLGMHKRQISMPHVESISCPLDSIDELALFFKKIQPNIVIHTAGLTNIEQCEASPELAKQVNIDLAENVAKVCLQEQIRFVHISTDHLFSGEKKSVTEEEPVAPLNVYAETKAEAEQHVLNVNSDALIIRTNFYGWGPAYRQSFSDYIINTLSVGKNITLYQDVFYTPIIVKTLANTVHDLIKIGESGIFNVTGDDRISKYEFGRKLAKQFNLDLSLIKSGLLSEQDTMTRRPYDMSLSNKKVNKLLGRKLGGVDEHLALLAKQQKMGFAKEIQSL